MSRSNRWVLGLIVVSLSVTITIIPTVRSQTPATNEFPVTLVAKDADATKPASTSTMVCKVYALTDLCEDPNLCKWISETVPQVIEPNTWGQGESGKPVLTYYELGKTLVVFHTPDTQKKVEAFLGNLKKAMPMPKVTSPVPTGKMPANNQGVVPAQYSQPSVIKTGDSTPVPTDYPVPTQTKSPKHLFHFIIRYEGDGIIDSNVVEFLKAHQGGQNSNNTPVTSYGSSAPAGPACCTPTSGGVTLPAPTYIQKTPAPISGYSMPVTPQGLSPALPVGMYLANPPMYATGVPSSLPLPPPPAQPGTVPYPATSPDSTVPSNNPPTGTVPRPSRVNSTLQPWSQQPFIY